MKILSIFVDESGDFGKYSKHSPYYVVTMVFHNQDNSIKKHIVKLNNKLKNLKCSEISIHTEPLIRKEESYTNLSPNERRNIFTKLFYFSLKCDINYKSFIYNKIEFKDSFELQTKMAKDMTIFMKEHLSYFQSFDQVILYYDNGQYQLTSILNSLLAVTISNYYIRKVIPSDYKLFQVADMICTLELINCKMKHGDLSRSEKLVFHSKTQIKKDFIKPIKSKEMK